MKEKVVVTVMGMKVMAVENVFAMAIEKDENVHLLSPNFHLTLKLTELIL